jgi:hypothetical protein
MRSVSPSIQGQEEKTPNGRLSTRADLENSIVCGMNRATGPSRAGLSSGKFNNLEQELCKSLVEAGQPAEGGGIEKKSEDALI